MRRLIAACLVASLCACAATPPPAATADKCKLINPAEAKYGDGC